MLQEPLLALDAAAVAAQGAVTGDDAVAWHDDAHGVDMVGLRHGAERPRVPDVLGLIAVALGLPVRDVSQLGPRTLLELGAYQVQGQ